MADTTSTTSSTSSNEKIYDFSSLDKNGNPNENSIYREYLKKNIDKIVSVKDSRNQFEPTFIDILKNINIHPLSSTPFVNGYFYIHMQSGTWVDHLDRVQSTNLIKAQSTSLTSSQAKDISQNAGKYIFQTELPNLMMETETVSGRLRNLNYATKAQLTGDFSISYHDNSLLDMFSYHHAWFKYIELLRRGDIDLDAINITKGEQYQTSEFIDVPYYNALWVIVFYPHSVTPVAIFKLMGVTPISYPAQSLIGDRGNPSIGLISQNYKCNDMIFDIRNKDNPGNTVFDKLLTEFIKVYKIDQNKES